MAVPGNVVLSEVTSGALFVSVFQVLKSKFPQIQNVPTWVLSILWALVSVILIGYEWTPNANGGGILTISIPSFAAAIMGLWKWGEQFAINELLQGGAKIIQTTPGKTGTAVAPPAPQPYPSQPPLPPSKYSVPEAQK